MGESPAHRIAFALSGLAGSNAWGAGFLHTALSHDFRSRIEPTLISCTSGQLYWTYVYLQLRQGRSVDGCTDIASLLKKQIEQADIVNIKVAVPGIGTIDLRDPTYLALCMAGVPQKFHVPWLENAAVSLVNWMNAIPSELFETPRDHEIFFIRELLRTWPATLLESDFDEGLYEEIARTIDASDIGVCFNVFQPRTGKEFVYLNDAAMKIFKNIGKELRPYDDRTTFHRFSFCKTPSDVDPVAAVRNALWVIFYGPPDQGRPIDAAYYRHVMLHELVPADTIFVVRPIHYRWRRPLPDRFLDMLDFLTQTFLNGVYAGERRQIVVMNKLRHHFPLLKERYHHISLREIEPDAEAPADRRDPEKGFFDYVFEETSLLQASGELTRRKFEAFLRGDPPTGLQR